MVPIRWIGVDPEAWQSLFGHGIFDTNYTTVHALSKEETS